MERRTAILAAAAVAGTFLIGATALTVNADLLKAPATHNIGQISPVPAPTGTISPRTARDSANSAPAVAPNAPRNDGHESGATHEDGDRDD